MAQTVAQLKRKIAKIDAALWENATTAKPNMIVHQEKVWNLERLLRLLVLELQENDDLPAATILYNQTLDGHERCHECGCKLEPDGDAGLCWYCLLDW